MSSAKTCLFLSENECIIIIKAINIGKKHIQKTSFFQKGHNNLILRFSLKHWSFYCIKISLKYFAFELSLIIFLGNNSNSINMSSYSTTVASASLQQPQSQIYSQDVSRGTNCDRTLNILQDVLKSGNFNFVSK